MWDTFNNLSGSLNFFDNFLIFTKCKDMGIYLVPKKKPKFLRFKLNKTNLY